MRAENLPERIVAKLKMQTDSKNKKILLDLLGDYPSETSIRGLLEQLEDKRDAQEKCPECIGKPLRVCDVAFDKLVFRLAASQLLHESGIMQSSKLWILSRYPANHNFDDLDGPFPSITSSDQYPVRNEAITALRSYYQTNMTKILQRLAKPSSTKERTGVTSHKSQI